MQNVLTWFNQPYLHLQTIENHFTIHREYYNNINQIQLLNYQTSYVFFCIYTLNHVSFSPSGISYFSSYLYQFRIDFINSFLFYNMVWPIISIFTNGRKPIHYTIKNITIDIKKNKKLVD